MLLLCAVFSGCSEFFPNDGRFVVDDIDLTNKRDKAIYRLIPIKGKGNLFYINNIGEYKIGDTIVLEGRSR